MGDSGSEPSDNPGRSNSSQVGKKARDNKQVPSGEPPEPTVAVSLQHVQASPLDAPDDSRQREPDHQPELGHVQATDERVNSLEYGALITVADLNNLEVGIACLAGVVNNLKRSLQARNTIHHRLDTPANVYPLPPPSDSQGELPAQGSAAHQDQQAIRSTSQPSRLSRTTVPLTPASSAIARTARSMGMRNKMSGARRS